MTSTDEKGLDDCMTYLVGDRAKIALSISVVSSVVNGTKYGGDVNLLNKNDSTRIRIAVNQRERLVSTEGWLALGT